LFNFLNDILKLYLFFIEKAAFNEKLTSYLTTMKGQLNDIYKLYKDYQKQGLTSLPNTIIQAIEERVNGSIVVYDYRNILDLVVFMKYLNIYVSLGKIGNDRKIVR